MLFNNIDSEIIKLDYFQFPKLGFETLLGLGKHAVAVKADYLCVFGVSTRMSIFNVAPNT